MRILVTGATGLLGSHLLKALQARNEQVRALVLPTEDAQSLEQQGIEVVRGDITVAETLPPALAGVEVVLHLAGMMGVWQPLAEYRRVNVEGALQLYYAAQHAGVRRYVHTSSHTVYGLGHARFLSEDEPLRPDPDPYSLSKAEADLRIRELLSKSAVETVLIRPGTFFGPGDQLHFGRIAQRLLAGKGLIIGRGDNALPFCYVDDVVQGFLLAAFHPQAPGQVYNITNDQPLTQSELFNAIADAVGAPRPRRRLPYAPIYYGSIVAEGLSRLTGRKPPVTRLGALMFGSDNRHSIAKARRELGFEPRVDLREGILRTASWFKEAGRTPVGSPATPQLATTQV